MSDRDCDHILCVICQEPILRHIWIQASLWHDPAGVTCVAHNDCLVALGENDLGINR